MRCGHDNCETCPYADCIDGAKIRKPKRVRNRTEYMKKYYLEHKQEKHEKYLKRRYRKKVMTEMERIRALIGNLKNWDWTIFPQFKLEKEDAVALQNLDALKEYVLFKTKEADDKKENIEKSDLKG